MEGWERRNGLSGPEAGSPLCEKIKPCPMASCGPGDRFSAQRSDTGLKLASRGPRPGKLADGATARMTDGQPAATAAAQEMARYCWYCWLARLI